MIHRNIESRIAKIDKYFKLSDKNQIVIHLSNFDWEFERFGEVTIVGGAASHKVMVVGYANHQGVPAMFLKPVSSGTVNEVASFLESNRDFPLYLYG